MIEAHFDKVHNPYTSCYHSEQMKMDCKGRNDEAKMIIHGNFCISPPSTLYKIVSDKEKPSQGMVFLQGREDDETISRSSTYTLNIERSYKVKAILDSKILLFSFSKVITWFDDYRLKHLIILGEINTTTTPRFHFSHNDYFNE
jgi:hypothetical protein